MALQAFDPPTMLPQPLSIPVPPAPILEHAIGYQGDARFVAFYWSPYGDEAMTADGKRSGTALGWYAFLAYIRHPVIARVLGRTLEESALGSSETDATHWLILDRETRQVGVMTVDAAEAFLRSQWPPAGPPLVMTMSEWQRLAADLVTHLEQQARTGAEQMLTEHNEAFEQLQAWLAKLGQGDAMATAIRTTFLLDENGVDLTTTVALDATASSSTSLRTHKLQVPKGGAPHVAHLLKQLATGKLDLVTAAQVLINAGVLAAPDSGATNPRPSTPLVINKMCPDCGKRLIIRRNSQNGSEFLGCTGYPECRHTEPIPESIKMQQQGALTMFDLMGEGGSTE